MLDNAKLGFFLWGVRDRNRGGFLLHIVLLLFLLAVLSSGESQAGPSQAEAKLYEPEVLPPGVAANSCYQHILPTHGASVWEKSPVEHSQ
eukprot:8328077-Pyramimonas_sp.AAC.2